ncbi:hypothetical protein BTVI_71312 [Pitangus sulphuratus]|nr:hypothetical protein BTVI_71312 [Pitangus sulphuratus]
MNHIHLCLSTEISLLQEEHSKDTGSGENVTGKFNMTVPLLKQEEEFKMIFRMLQDKSLITYNNCLPVPQTDNKLPLTILLYLYTKSFSFKVQDVYVNYLEFSAAGNLRNMKIVTESKRHMLIAEGSERAASVDTWHLTRVNPLQKSMLAEDGLYPTTQVINEDVIDDHYWPPGEHRKRVASCRTSSC